MTSVPRPRCPYSGPDSGAGRNEQHYRNVYTVHIASAPSQCDSSNQYMSHLLKDHYKCNHVLQHTHKHNTHTYIHTHNRHTHIHLSNNHSMSVQSGGWRAEGVPLEGSKESEVPVNVYKRTSAKTHTPFNPYTACRYRHNGTDRTQKMINQYLQSIHVVNSAPTVHGVRGKV